MARVLDCRRTRVLKASQYFALPSPSNHLDRDEPIDWLDQQPVARRRCTVHAKYGPRDMASAMAVRRLMALVVLSSPSPRTEQSTRSSNSAPSGCYGGTAGRPVDPQRPKKLAVTRGTSSVRAVWTFQPHRSFVFEGLLAVKDIDVHA